MELLAVGFFALVALQGILLVVCSIGACLPEKKKK
jgi:hypothetical protein